MSAVAYTTTDTLFDALNAAVQRQWEAHKGSPLFVTHTGRGALFDQFLHALPESERQNHNCNCCRSFINRFGGLVVVDAATGYTRSAVWPQELHDVPELYRRAVDVLRNAVLRSAVSGVFSTDLAMLGTPETGAWRHFAVTPSVAVRNPDRTRTASSAMAAFREDYRNLNRTLAEFSIRTIDSAIALLRSSAFVRGAQFIAPLEFIRNAYTHKRTSSAARQDHSRGSQLLWHAVATAPAGWCSQRGGMTGMLLQMIDAGETTATITRAWNARANGERYMRPTAAPTQGNLAEAERVVAALGVERSLHRRFARRDELQTIWTPRELPRTERAGVFGHLYGAGEPTPPVRELPLEAMTWARFARTVLPDALRIELRVHEGTPAAYSAFTTAVHADAPPILQWDRDESRNPVSTFTYVELTYPRDWNLTPGWAALASLAYNPESWFDRASPQQVHAVFATAHPQQNPGLALFPETLRRELHAIRATIEAHSASRALEGRTADAAVFLTLPHRSAVLRVTPTTGIPQCYTVDRWD